jgi:hypothetical protein
MIRIYQPDGFNAELSWREGLDGGARIALTSSPGMALAAALMSETEVRLDAESLLSGEPQTLGPAEWVLFKPRWGPFFVQSCTRWSKVRKRQKLAAEVVQPNLASPTCRVVIKAGFAPEKMRSCGREVTGDISSGILFNRSNDPPHQTLLS